MNFHRLTANDRHFTACEEADGQFVAADRSHAKKIGFTGETVTGVDLPSVVALEEVFPWEAASLT